MAVIDSLTGDPKAWLAADRQPLEFARLLTVAAPTIPDSLFENLRKQFGDNQVASMVLLAAYGNFKDRIVLGLNLPMEETGPLPPIDVEFVEGALQIASLFAQLIVLNGQIQRKLTLKVINTHSSIWILVLIVVLA